MAAGKEYLLEISGFSGVNNLEREQDLASPIFNQEQPGPLEAREIKNFNLTNKETLVSRDGYVKEVSLTSPHSGFPFDPYVLGVCSQGLVGVHTETKAITVLKNVSPFLTMSFVRFGDGVFWANGEEKGKIVKTVGGIGNVDWGIPTPPNPTLAVGTGGGLRAGLYQVALTYLSGYVESGASTVKQIDVPAGGSILLTNIPQEATKTRIYVSSFNGEVLYKYADVTGTSATIVSGTLGRKLETQFMEEPPIGHILRYYRGRIIIAKDKWVFYTVPQRPHLCKISVDWLPPFSRRIRMIQTVEDGFYVDNGELYFVQFSKADEVKLVTLLAEQFGVIEGTDLSVPAHIFQEAGDGNLAYWWTKRGFPVVGKKGGIIVPVGKKELSIDQYGSGASVLLEKSGLTQIISSFGGGGPRSNVGLSDSLTATIINRGV
mgnify:CR=1 FL=1